MIKLIAFTGPAGAGKSTAAQGMVAHRAAFKMSFAHPIREMLHAFGLSWDQLNQGKHEPIGWLGGKTPAQLMQTLGTEWGRELVDPNVWVKICAQKVRSYQAAKGNVIVFDDCRFDNEADMIRALGGIVVRVESDCQRIQDSRPKGHKSEAGVSPHMIDLTIVNAGEGRDEFQRLVLSSLNAR